MALTTESVDSVRETRQLQDCKRNGTFCGMTEETHVTPSASKTQARRIQCVIQSTARQDGFDCAGSARVQLP